MSWSVGWTRTKLVESSSVCRLHAVIDRLTSWPRLYLLDWPGRWRHFRYTSRCFRCLSLCRPGRPSRCDSSRKKSMSDERIYCIHGVFLTHGTVSRRRTSDIRFLWMNYYYYVRCSLVDVVWAVVIVWMITNERILLITLAALTAQ